MRIVTLTTDFGQRDGYVGIMKGVILGIAPAVTLVDISHDISPQSVAEAAFVLHMSYRYFPKDAIHLVVVDPGVGTDRRPIAVETPHGIFVAPDNGVLSYVLNRETGWSAVHLTESRYWLPHVSHTFHGRDIFAPVAAHLASGIPIREFGSALRDPVLWPMPDVVATDAGELQATVWYVDRFGNIVTTLPADMSLSQGVVGQLGNRLQAQIGEETIRGLRATYGEADAGELLLLVGSSGFVEVVCRDGHAAAMLKAQLGDTVVFRVV